MSRTWFESKRTLLHVHYYETQKIETEYAKTKIKTYYHREENEFVYQYDKLIDIESILFVDNLKKRMM